jgi:hypothetical protein
MTLLGGRLDRSNDESNIIEHLELKSLEEQKSDSLLSQESILMQKVEDTNNARKSFFADWLTQSGIH